MGRVKVTVNDRTQVNDHGHVYAAGETFETDEGLARRWDVEGLVTVAPTAPAKRAPKR